MRAKKINEDVSGIFQPKSGAKEEINKKIQEIKDVDPELVHEFENFIVVPGNFSTKVESSRTIINKDNYKMYNVGLYAAREVINALKELL